MLNRAVGLAISVADLAGVHITFGQEFTRVDSRAVLIDIHGKHQAVGFITLAAGCGAACHRHNHRSRPGHFLLLAQSQR